MITSYHTHTRRVIAIAIIAIIAVLAAITAPAATITWSAATAISGDLDVSTTGTLVAAHNVYFIDGGNLTGNNLVPLFDTTVNGVLFTGFGFEGGQPSSTLGAITASSAGLLSGLNTVGSPLPPFSSLSANYQTLLSTIGSGAGQFTLTLGGLTVGQTYQFQVWTSLSSVGVSNTSTATGGGSSILLDPNTTNADGGTGQFTIGTFIADNAAQAVDFQGLIGDPFINAFQLRQLGPVLPPDPPISPIPEPASAIVGMLLLGLCGTRLGQRRS